ncbi:uncharacterized protein SOCEGT47_030770 [Sorangium cellulosum]|uniref:Secreted protein n=1 Tax=Sorangium cellulosum TaxID=56 RepID=A0A4P2Q147_SORCE|nr:hypothetical protein [Sorangium cellulosum]AUX22573.1 uncharacterized protein SOCEGT47_030770 [Sorangium cellulosum]
MKKSLVSSIVLAAATLSASAMALDTNERWNVEIDVLDELIGIGEMECVSNPWAAERNVCAYACAVEANGFPRDTTNLFLLEQKTFGRNDCDENAEVAFNTILANDPDQLSKLIFTNEKLEVNATVLGEERDNDLSGAIVFEGVGYVVFGIFFDSIEDQQSGDDDDGGEEMVVDGTL